MTKTALALAVFLACGCSTAPEPAARGPQAAYPDKAFKLTCGAETFDIHFTDQEAHLSSAQGMSMLKRVDGGPATYTNGQMTFTRSGDGQSVSFARGRMAPVACTAV